jgi:hypothetical protein
MAKNNKGINQLVEKLAILSDTVDKFYPNGKKMVVFELNETEFKDAKIQFGMMDNTVKRFNVDMSGVEIIFIEDGLLNTEEGKT